MLRALKSKKGKVNCKKDISTNGVSIHDGISLSNPEDAEEEIYASDREVKGRDKRSSTIFGRKKKKKKVMDVKFNCWDLGGQEIFYPTHQFFLTDQSIYLLVFNTMDVESSRVEYWMRQIKSLTNNSSKTVVLLVGTHCEDQYASSDIKNSVLQNFQRKFPKSRFSFLQGIFFVSAKTGEGLSDLKAKIISIANKKDFQPVVSQSWVNFYDFLLIKRAEFDYIEWKTFAKWANSADIPPKSLELATEFLSCVGALIHFSDDKLSNLVILNPQWLSDVMSSLITFNHTWISGGLLSLTKIPQVFKKYPPNLHESLLALLEKFNIVNRLSPDTCSIVKEEQILVCSLLPEQRPIEIEGFWGCNQLPIGKLQQGRVYKFPFLPLGFVNKIMVRLLHVPDLKGILFWRNGLVMQCYHQLGMLSYDPISYECTVLVRTPDEKKDTEVTQEDQIKTPRSIRRDILLLRIIVNAIDTLIESYKMNQVQKFIPCTHCYKTDITKPPFYFTFDECTTALTNGYLSMFCNHSPDIVVPLYQLAPDISFFDIPIIKYSDISLSKQLGKGAFGTVYLAELFNTLVAVKQLNFDNDEEAFSDFQHEVYIMRFPFPFSSRFLLLFLLTFASTSLSLFLSTSFSLSPHLPLPSFVLPLLQILLLLVPFLAFLLFLPVSYFTAFPPFLLFSVPFGLYILLPFAS